MTVNATFLSRFFVLLTCGMLFVVASCSFKTRDLPWQTGIVIEVQLSELFEDLSIHWRGEMLSPAFPQGRDRDRYVIPENNFENIPDQSCPPVIEADGIIRCPGRHDLHPGDWEFTVEVRSAGVHIPGSPFTCTIQMVVPGHDLRVIQGGIGRAACIGVRGRTDFPHRVGRGLVALYTFDEGKGNTVNDVSGVNPPLDLRIRERNGTVRPADQVNWGTGSLILDASTLVSSEGPGSKLAEHLMASREISVEAWIRPRPTNHGELARIATLSGDVYNRNFTLGSQAGKYAARLRVTDQGQTNANGLPPLETPDGAVTTGLTQVVYVRNAAGEAKIYINGAEQATAGVAGDFSGWDTGYGFALANEFGDAPAYDRSWLGEYHLVAIYERAITQDEIVNNWFAGHVTD